MFESLLYISNRARLDTFYAAGYLYWFMENPIVDYWKCAKKILQYLRGAKNLVLIYTKAEGYQILGYKYFDWGQGKQEKTSVGRYSFTFPNGPISWKNKKQNVVAQNSAEAKFMAFKLDV